MKPRRFCSDCLALMDSTGVCEHRGDIWRALAEYLAEELRSMVNAIETCEIRTFPIGNSTGIFGMDVRMTGLDKLKSLAYHGQALALFEREVSPVHESSTANKKADA